MRRYPEYKESGVEWIRKIPSHWKVKRLKYIAKIVASYVDKHINPDEIQANLCNYTDVYYHEKIDSSIDFMKGSCNQNEYERSLIQNGDIIITKDSESADDIGVPAFIQEELTNVVCGYHLSIIRSLNEIDGQFLFRFIQSNQTGRYFEVNAVGITRFSLGKAIIENLSTPLPPLSEQTQIANFLDRKTGQINELIRIKERQVELLQEKRTALINQAVTKGLDPTVEMKPSGVEWIGKIPKSWEAMPIKHTLQIAKDSIRTGPFGSSLKSYEFQDKGIRVYNQQSVYKEDINRSDIFISEEKFNELKSFIVQPKDVLITSRGTIGKMTIVPEDGEIGVLHPCLIRLRLNEDKLIPKYLWWYVNHSSLFFESVKIESNTTTIEVIYSDTLSGVKIPIPPLKEQLEILEFLNVKIPIVDTAISNTQKKIELLKEYRQSLISEAVTGKIDVRNEV